MEYRIRKEYDEFLPEYNHRTLYGTDVWHNIGEIDGSSRKIRCNSPDEAREIIKEVHNKYITNTVDDESSVVEKFIL